VVVFFCHLDGLGYYSPGLAKVRSFFRTLKSLHYGVLAHGGLLNLHEKHFVECSHYAVEDHDWQGSIHSEAFAASVDSPDVADGADFLKAAWTGDQPEHSYLLLPALYPWHSFQPKFSY